MKKMNSFLNFEPSVISKNKQFMITLGLALAIYINSFINGNKYLTGLLGLTLAFYVINIKPEIPSAIEKIINNRIFKLVLLIYILYLANIPGNLQTPILIASLFLLTTHMINRLNVERFINSVYYSNK